MIIIDIHNYRAISEIHGTDGAKQVLRSMAALLERGVRREDLVARYGTYRFAVLCRETSEATALVVAERLRDDFAQERFVVDDVSLSVDVRLGIAGFTENRLQSAASLAQAAASAAQAAAEQSEGAIVLFSSLADRGAS